MNEHSAIIKNYFIFSWMDDIYISIIILLIIFTWNENQEWYAILIYDTLLLLSFCLLLDFHIGVGW